jgi:hypothetical protein
MSQRAYWTIDAEFDAVQSIAATADFLALVDHKPHYWKWSVLGIHSAIQGALVLALNNENSVLVQKPGVARKMLAAYEGDQDFPSPYMDSFLGLYRKARIRENLRVGVDPLPDDLKQERAMKALDELRDEFTHFNHKTWSIERVILVQCPLACCAVLRHLLECGAIRWYRQSSPKRALSSLVKIERILQARAN